MLNRGQLLLLSGSTAAIKYTSLIEIISSKYEQLKQQARVVIIGGGIVGVSILYHLTVAGWSDVVLCERSELTAGSTWHAAGLLPLYHPGYSIGRINKYSVDFYQALEAETGQAVSFHKTGNLRIASSRDRMESTISIVFAPGCR